MCRELPRRRNGEGFSVLANLARGRGGWRDEKESHLASGEEVLFMRAGSVGGESRCGSMSEAFCRRWSHMELRIMASRQSRVKG